MKLPLSAARFRSPLLYSSNVLLATSWLEQFTFWIISLGVDWAKLPWAFAGATIATLKSKKDAQGQPIHKPFWEWIASALGGMVIGLAAWRDVMGYLHLSEELSTIIAGLIGWLLADIVLKKASSQLTDKTDITSKKP